LFLRFDLVSGGKNGDFSEVLEVIVVSSSRSVISGNKYADGVDGNDVPYLVCDGSDIVVLGGS